MKYLPASLVFFSLLFSCESSQEYGIVSINLRDAKLKAFDAINRSNEIRLYHVISENPRSYRSVELSSLATQGGQTSPGQYVLISDCSATEFVLAPGERKIIDLFKVELRPPVALSEEISKSHLEVHCQSTSENHSFRQNIKDRYELFMQKGRWDLLVGLYPMTLNIDETENLKLELGALLVSSPSSPEHQFHRYFVSSKEHLSSSVVNQISGQPLILPEGRYEIELNGTTKPVTIVKNEVLKINAQLFQVNANVDLNMVKVPDIPPHVLISDKAWTPLNSPIFVLPGEHKFRFSKSFEVHSFSITEDEPVTFVANKIRVNSSCPNWMHGCLGKIRVNLFREGSFYPFIKTKTDHDVFFLDENAYVSLEGTSTLQRKIKLNSKKTKIYKTGKLVIKPLAKIHKNVKSDLLRIEPANTMTRGNSYDISMNEETSIPLLTGWYKMTRYDTTAISQNEDSRRKTSYNFKIQPDQPTTLEIPIYMQQRSYDKWLEQLANQRRLKSLRRLGSIERKGVFANSIEIE